MKRVLFICHGNICRSPMAEMIFVELLRQRNLLHQFHIASSATSTEEIIRGVGNPIYPPARAELEKHHIPCHPHAATQLRKSDYQSYDLLIGMDDANLRNMKRILGSDPEGKIQSFRHADGTPIRVADPWYSGNFSAAFRDIYEGCTVLLESLLHASDT